MFKAVKRAGAVLKLLRLLGSGAPADGSASFILCGKFYRSNVQLLVERIGQEEPHAKMGPLQVHAGARRASTNVEMHITL